MTSTSTTEKNSRPRHPHHQGVHIRTHVALVALVTALQLFCSRALGEELMRAQDLAIQLKQQRAQILLEARDARTAIHHDAATARRPHETLTELTGAVVHTQTMLRTEHSVDTVASTCTGEACTSTPSPPPRRELISMAAKFLKTPTLASASPDKVKLFLANKGLTPQEVHIALDVAGGRTNLEPAGPSGGARDGNAAPSEERHDPDSTRRDSSAQKVLWNL